MERERDLSGWTSGWECWSEWVGVNRQESVGVSGSGGVSGGMRVSGSE